MIELTIVGNVGSVRLNETQNSQVLTVTIASNRRVAEKEYTEWVAAKVWGTRAKSLFKHIKPGRKLLVRGRPRIAIYERRDGSQGHEMECHVNTLEFVGPSQSVAPQEIKSPPGRKKKAAANGADNSKKLPSTPKTSAP